MPRVNVLRTQPRDRSKIDGLCGTIYTTIISESYIHVGSSSSILFTLDESSLVKLIKGGKRDVKSLLQVTKFMEVMRFNVSDGRPVIPGSSIKGNIRSRIELSLRPRDGYVRSCFIRARPPLIHEPLKGTSGWRHFRIWGEVLFEERGPPCDLTRMDRVCLVCDLFGTAGLKSLIEFSDFVGEGYTKDVLEVLSLEHGMKLEAAKPGTKFNGRIVFQNLKPVELGLLFVGMKIGKSVLLGRLKYRHKVSGRAFGKAKYEIKAIELLGESQGLEVQGLRVRGGERIEGAELTKLIESLKSLANEEFKGEIVDVDEVAVVERLQ